MNHHKRLTERRARKLAPIDFVLRHFTGLGTSLNETSHLAAALLAPVDAFNIHGMIAEDLEVSPTLVNDTGLQAKILDAIGHDPAVFDCGHVLAMGGGAHGSASGGSAGGCDERGERG